MACNTLPSYRVAEKFTILNDRLNGLLKRLYNMKQELNSNEKPMFLPGGDKTFDGALKTLYKKFPTFDAKVINIPSMAPFINIHEDILSRLSSYFYTLVEVSEIKKPIMEILELMRKLNVQLDISINFELTKSYLNLITNYSCIMLFLTKISDIKAIIAIFNFAYEYKTGEQEKHVGEIADKLLEVQPDKVLKNLYAEFSPHTRIITAAIRSLTNCYSPRLVKSQNWTEVKFLDILHEPDKLSHTALTDRMCTQLLLVEEMERWIILCTFLIHPELNNTEMYNVWKAAFKNSYVLVLFRDEIMYFHHLAVQFFETLKNSSKRVSEVKDMYQLACSQSPTVHKDRRNYLRLILRQLCQIISDEPGLLGPKSFLVLWSLSYATDEIYWLLRHSDNIPQKKGPVINLNTKINVEEFNDTQLPELLFYIEDIRRLILKFQEIIQIFYQQILAEYDAPGLRYMVKDVINRCGAESNVILTSIYQTLTQVDSATERDRLNFQGIRLDWFRAQFYLSIGSSPINLSNHMKLVSHINSTMFHTKMIDFLPETVKECADLSVFCFYDRKFQEYYERNITYSSQHRYAIVFPLICTHYINVLDEYCPEEMNIIMKRANTNALKCLKNISSHITQLISQTMDSYSSLALQLVPKEALFYIPIKKDKKKVKTATLPSKGRSNSIIHRNTAMFNEVKSMPGTESRRKTRENQTTLDKSLLALTQLCFTINHYREIVVWDKPFVPRDILSQELIDMFNDKLIKCVEMQFPYDNSNKNIGDDILFVRPPSEMLIMIQEYMTVLMNVDKHVNVDVVRIFNDVFLSQSQLRDTYKGNQTIVAAYIKWYMEAVMKFAARDIFVYSPRLKSFVTMNADNQPLAFRAEEYADLRELRALVEILGPFGCRLLTEAISQEIAKIVEEKLKKLVMQNKSTLESLRESVHEPAQTRKLTSFLCGVEELLGCLKRIGVLLAFRDLCREACGDVLSQRVPFLHNSVKDLQQTYAAKTEAHLLQMMCQQQDSNVQEEQQAIYERVNEQLIINDLCMSMGLYCSLDSNLCSAIESRRLKAVHTSGSPGTNAASGADLDYKVAYLLFTFIAYALPKLARIDSTYYHIELEAHGNNSHCIAYAINSLMMVLFARYGQEELENREKEFMALTSSNLLRLGLENSGSSLLQLELNQNSRNSVSNTSNASGNSSSNNSSLQDSSPPKNLHSVYVLFDIMTQLCTCLTADLREACFPYALIRQAYHVLAKQAVGNQKSSSPSSLLSSQITNSSSSGYFSSRHFSAADNMSHSSNMSSSGSLRNSVTITSN